MWSCTGHRKPALLLPLLLLLLLLLLPLLLLLLLSMVSLLMVVSPPPPRSNIACSLQQHSLQRPFGHRGLAMRRHLRAGIAASSGGNKESAA